MRECEIVPARLTHVGPIALNMREADRRECEALGRSPKEALRNGLRCSLRAFTAVEGQTPLAMFGVVSTSLLGGYGRIWFLSADRAFDYRRRMLRFGRAIVNEWLSDFDALGNIVAADNFKAITMLRHWHFEIGSELEFHGGLAFLPFRRERKAIQELRAVA